MRFIPERDRVLSILGTAGGACALAYAAGLSLSFSLVETGKYGLLLVMLAVLCIDRNRGWLRAMRSPLVLVALAFSLWLFVTYLARDIDVQPARYLKDAAGVLSTLFLPAALLAAYAARFRPGPAFARRLLAVFLGGLLVTGLAGILFLFTGETPLHRAFNFAWHPDRASSFLHYIALGAFAAQGWFLAAGLVRFSDRAALPRGERGVALVSLALLPVVLWATNDRVLIVAFLLVAGVYAVLWLARRRWVRAALFAAPLVALAALALFDNPVRRRMGDVTEFVRTGDDAKLELSNYCRWVWYRAMLDMGLRHPVTGIGYRGFEDYFTAHYRSWWKRGDYFVYHPHNDWLGLFSQTGVPGVLLWGGLLGLLGFTALRRPRPGGAPAPAARPDAAIGTGVAWALLIFLANGMTDYNLQLPHLALLAFYIALVTISRQPAPEGNPSA